MIDLTFDQLDGLLICWCICQMYGRPNDHLWPVRNHAAIIETISFYYIKSKVMVISDAYRLHQE